MTVKVGVVGYGTIGKRVADAVMLQNDMKLMGITGNTYNFRMEIAKSKGIPIYSVAGEDDFRKNGVDIAGTMKDLLKEVDIIVDATPKKIGRENKEKFYNDAGVKVIYQGGEKPDIAEASFVAQCNYDEAIDKDHIRVVSCNTTGLCRTLQAVDQLYGIENVHATMIRRATDPMDVKKGPINAIVPELELPSHHGPDVRTVLHKMEIFTTALSVSTTLMHMHNLTVDVKETPEVNELIKMFRNTTRVRVVRCEEKVRSTAEIMELARDLNRTRGDMPEICVWEQGIGTYKKKIFYMQAIHQESDVIPENIDCIRAMTGFTDAKKSIAITNRSLGI
ncbi:MAG: type II glyceraldehyde-3-phosphate dehydrogenase [archaeon]